jgi:hypothetical protein
MAPFAVLNVALPETTGVQGDEAGSLAGIGFISGQSLRAKAGRCKRQLARPT